MNKTIQVLKREVDRIKKAQSEATLEIETLGKISETIDASISNRIQEMEERISDAEDSIESMDTTIRENAKLKKNSDPGLTRGTSPFRSTRAPRYLASRVARHPQGPSQGYPRDPKTPGEWNTAPSPIQSHGT